MRCLRITPRVFARWLPLLGGVLYVAGRHADDMPQRLPRGLLSDSAALMPLLRTRWLAVASLITEDGPREWLECLDGEGQLCARLHLLPDTDYLAWDELLQMAKAGAPPHWSRWRRGFRPTDARLLCFRYRELAGLSVLDAVEPQAFSSLGRQMAQRIAQAEAVVLQGM